MNVTLLPAEQCLFEKVIPLFDTYFRLHVREDNTGIYSDGCAEARKRLHQLGWLLQKVRGLMQEMNDPLLNKNPDHIYRIGAALDEAEIFTEAFYWFAFRTRQVIRTLPGLKTLKCKAIVEVRNHLLEHPEGNASGVTKSSFSTGFPEFSTIAPTGPQIKSVRPVTDKTIWKDKGLYINAAEMFGELQVLLERTIVDNKGIPT